MCRYDDMRLARNQQALAHRYVFRLKGIQLFGENNRVDHDTVAYKVSHMCMENPGRDGVQYVLGSFEFKSMTGIRPALKACNDVVSWCEYIHQFSFALVAPLQSEQYIYFIVHGKKK